MGNRIVLLACLACFTGCVQKVETSKAPDQTKWQYHVERIENRIHKSESDTTKNISSMSNEDYVQKLAMYGRWPGQVDVDSIQLDKLGDEGWEMCACFVEPETVQPYGDTKSPNTRAGATVMIFKRPIRN